MNLLPNEKNVVSAILKENHTLLDIQDATSPRISDVCFLMSLLIPLMLEKCILYVERKNGTNWYTVSEEARQACLDDQQEKILR
jgi:hypothetical protein